MLKKSKKFVSFLLVLALSAMVYVPAFAATSTQNQSISNNQVSLSVSDLQNGVTVKANTLTGEEVVFTLKLQGDISGIRNLRWTAYMLSGWSNLKNVTGNIYVKSSSVLQPIYYYNDSIDCPYLDGSTRTATNVTGTFFVPSSGIVLVGWTNVYLVGISDTFSVGNAGSPVQL